MEKMFPSRISRFFAYFGLAFIALGTWFFKKIHYDERHPID
jgi:hypothetical protein